LTVFAILSAYRERGRKRNNFGSFLQADMFIGQVFISF